MEVATCKQWRTVAQGLKLLFCVLKDDLIMPEDDLCCTNNTNTNRDTNETCKQH